ncbi:shikimate kinase [Pelagibacterales bacterium SAG-MED29]|nr:shikimate kinase [Pelagibacterales bacterium SAG-MED29]
MKKNLVLTGMMGVGKSTIGKKLAKNLQRKFVDIDEIIETKEKKTIKEIFENEGEHYFRKIEKKITHEELKKDNLIIALGGGAFINTSIRREIKSSCLSFWLDLKVESLLIRLKNIKKRPLLDEDKLKKSINKIYSERKKIYNESNFRIKCNAMNKDEIVYKIIELYENAKNKL